MTLMLGGRNSSSGGAMVKMAVDEHQLDDLPAPPGFFLQMTTIPMGALDGPGEFARLSVSADRPGVSIEQFDAQPAGHVVFGFGDGWHEREHNPSTGRMWRWMSERGVIRVHGDGHPLRLTLTGETETFSRASHLRIRAGDRVVAEWTVGRAFSVDALIPAAAQSGDDTAIVVETDQFFVPAERSRRTQDRRHLALRVYDCQIKPVF